MSSPLVAIVTPVYQGGAQLAECVESVRAQGYESWIHTLVDNQSTDETAEIGAALAASDPRIRFVRYEEHLGMLANWNRAFEHVPGAAVYLRQLSADDRLAPGCLERAVAAAEAHPDVAIISSYFLNGTQRRPAVLHSSELRIPGREVVRNLFLGGIDYLAQPSVLLLRRAALRGAPHLYDPRDFPPGLAGAPPFCQGDKEGFFATLRESDLLFVPETLVFLRKDQASATGDAWRIGAWHAGWLELLMRHGEEFLEPGEIARTMHRITFKYVRSIVWRNLKGRRRIDREFGEFHRHALGHLIPALRARGFDGHARVLASLAPLIGRAPIEPDRPDPTRDGEGPIETLDVSE